jgi:hypothetical protein
VRGILGIDCLAINFEDFIHFSSNHRTFIEFPRKMSDFYLLLLAVSCALTFTESEKHVKSVESGTVTVEKFK